MKTCLVCFSLLLCSACANGPGATDTGEPAEKSVFLAELIAIFPGFFVHGLGHRYAGNPDVARELLAMEGYSLLVGGLGGALLALGESEDAEVLEVAGWVGIGVASIPFLGTWIYDIVYTPSEVRRYNRRIEGE